MKSALAHIAITGIALAAPTWAHAEATDDERAAGEADSDDDVQAARADEPRVAADVEPLAVERVVPGEACDDAVIDPVVTPMRDAYLDAQR
ncbi:MAG TPA: hypothetical protein VMZ53_19505, partial [Kofleriaceae bacterium]|nr:hypothetical protein [Kofleriaceae bacterium]